MSKIYIKEKYGQIPNELLNNDEISLKAKGLFGYLQSKPDGWDFSEERITKKIKEGKTALHSAIKELEEYGYLRRESNKDSEGKWSGYNYTLSGYPFDGKPVKRVTRLTEKGVTLSKKETVRKNNKESKDIVSSADGINEIFNIFYESVNPDINYANMTNRKAVEELIDRYGLDDLKSITKYAISVQDKKYAPVITTPYQLKEKLGKLKVYHERNKGGNKYIKI